MNPPVRALLFATDATLGAQIAAILEADGHSVIRHNQINVADEVLRRERPDLVIVAEMGLSSSQVPARLGMLARELKVPSLLVMAAATDLPERVAGFDEWVDPSRVAVEFALRVRKLLLTPVEATMPAIDPRFLALVVHDLRTPLNVIGLTIRAIGQSNPTPSTDFEEDLTFLQENAKQIEKMLAQLGDYCRLIESEKQTSHLEFQTRRFLADFLEEKQSKRNSEYTAVRLEYAADSPAEVALDPARVRLAIGHALSNAVAAAGDAPIKLRSKGTSDRWVIEVAVEKAPPPTTTSMRLQSHHFERLVGSAAERRGLDLAIASRITELFGGSARMDVEPGLRSVITLEWPTRPPT